MAQYDKVPYDPTEALTRAQNNLHDAQSNPQTDTQPGDLVYQNLVKHCIDRNMIPPRPSEHLPVSAPAPTIISQKLNDPSNRWREFLLIEKINPCATIPKIATQGSVGYDLTSVMVGTIMPGKRHKIGTGLRVSVPHGHYGRIAPRSGLAWKSGIDVFAGVIDPDYQDEVCIILVNFGESPFEYNVGDRIAQMILEKCSTLPVKEVASIKDHAGSSKRVGGFGSTGKK